MDNLYRLEAWHEAFAMIGAASAALAGLLIVAVSVRADQIVHEPHLWMRARNATVSMITLTVGSLIFLVPQPPTFASIETIIYNLLCAAFLPAPVVVHQLHHRTGISILGPALASSFYVFAAGGGLSLILEKGGGMLWIVFAYGAYLLLAPYNAYLLLIPRKHGK